MNEYQIIYEANRRVEDSMAVATSATREWEIINNNARQTYNNLYEIARKLSKNINMPTKSYILLQTCDSFNVVGDMRRRLTLYLEKVLKEVKVKQYMDAYLSLMDQLLRQSYVVLGMPVPGADNMWFDPNASGVAGSSMSTSLQTSPKEASSASYAPHDAIPHQIQHGPILNKRAMQVMAPTANTEATTRLQRGLVESELEIVRGTRQLGEMLDVVQRATQAFHDQFGAIMPQLVAKQDSELWYAEYVKMQQAHQEFREKQSAALIDMIVDLEKLYRLGASTKSAADNPMQTQFEDAMHSVVTRLEGILRDVGKWERIPIQQNTTFDPTLMEADREEIVPPSPQMAGNVAYVIAPGFWRTFEDGSVQVARLATVRRYKGSGRR